MIISHVKDGADLGRKHHLPQSFIDLIEQHHGTTIVEYFYHQAKTSNSESDVEESDYRYPGPSLSPAGNGDDDECRRSAVVHSMNPLRPEWNIW